MDGLIGKLIAIVILLFSFIAVLASFIVTLIRDMKNDSKTEYVAEDDSDVEVEHSWKNLHPFFKILILFAIACLGCALWSHYFPNGIF